jgi:6-phosphogluconolactonase
MAGELVVVDDLASAFATRVIEAFHSRPDEGFALVLSGGDTARTCYERLGTESADAMDWWQVDVYWADERCGPDGAAGAHQRLVRESLLERVGAANAVYPMRCDDGADAYHLVVSDLDRFDLVHLDLSPEGHVASLFAGSDALQADPGRLAATSTAPDGDARLTLTLGALARARLIIVTASGPETAAALGAARRGDPSCPASRVRADEIVWLADTEAAGGT